MTDKRTEQEKAGNPIDVKMLKEELNFTPEQRDAQQKIIQSLRSGDLQDALAIKEEFSLPDEILSGLEEREAACEGMSLELSRGLFKNALEFQNKFILTAEQVAKSAKDAFTECLLSYYDSGEYGHYIEYALKIQEDFSLSAQTVQEVGMKAIIACLSSYYNPQKDEEYLNYADEIIERFNISNEMISNAKLQNQVKNVITSDLEYGCVSHISQIIEKFSVKPETIYSSEVKSSAKEALCMCLCDGRFDDAEKVKHTFSLAPDEIQYSVRKALGDCLLDRDHEQFAKEIDDKFPIPPKAMQDMFKKVIDSFIDDRDTSRIINLIDNYPVLEDTINDPEIQKRAAEFALNELLEYRSDENNNGRDYFCFIESAVDIVERFHLSAELFSKPNIQNVLKEALVEYLYNGETDNAYLAMDKFKINITPSELVDRDPVVKKMLNRIKDTTPVFYEQALKSMDIAFSLFSLAKNPEQALDAIKNNPFLIEAVSENPRFGSKLLVKYPEFDEDSKDNIKFMFEAKKEILSENPEMDPESNEFRIAMQKNLKTYKNNGKIVEKIASNGIDVEKWLNYSETEYFSLDSGNSKLSFSETVATPINRIKETISTYTYRVKEVIKEYQEDLMGHKLQDSGNDEMNEVMEKMENELSRAIKEGNEVKAKGMETGIANLKEKMKKRKEIPLWDKIMGDINAFDRLKNDVFKSHDNVIKAEEKFKEYSSDKTVAARDLLEAKRILSRAKNDLKEKFGLLEKRIEDFRENIGSILSVALGEARSSSLVQEIKEGLGEQFNHYDSDSSTLANLFSERSDREREKLESRPMSIFAWARNPDVDLYQGNYSPCCISIESGFYGDSKESTISDYGTDLGIQIVNIWDEAKNEPVTAAWCWIGTDEDGNSALVVDNIESNTLYSTNYSEQLSDKLFEYLMNYARSIGVKKLVMGKANNDLPSASGIVKMDSDDKTYKKTGEYNRPGGYYLEAEEAGVKIIWENQNEKEQKKKRNSKSKIGFNNCKTRSLSREDLDNVLKLEEEVYGNEDLNQGEELIVDIENGNGFDYSLILTGEESSGKKEVLGYIVGVEDETDEGKSCVYLEDIVVSPKAQGQGFGWEIMKNMIEKLKDKAAKSGKPLLFDMHLRESSQRLIEKHKEDLKTLGLRLVDEALVPDYYNEGEDALYQIYEITDKQ